MGGVSKQAPYGGRNERKVEKYFSGSVNGEWGRGQGGSMNASNCIKYIPHPGKNSTGFCPCLKGPHSQTKVTNHSTEGSQAVWLSMPLTW